MKKSTNISSIIFMVLGILFLVYGVYMIITAIKYVTTYTTTATISIGGSMQYVMSSSISYFGFGLLFIGVSIIIKKLNAIINSAVATTPAAPVTTAAVVPTPAAEPETKSAAIEDVPDDEDNEEPEFEVEYIYADEPQTEEPQTEEPQIIRDPLAIPSDGLPEIQTTPADTPMTLEEPPIVSEDTEPEFEVEYIYADEPEADVPVEEPEAEPEPEVEVEPVSTTNDEFKQVISELEEIKIEEELAGISEEIAEDVQSEEASFKITSDFIKNIFESK